MLTKLEKIKLIADKLALAENTVRNYYYNCQQYKGIESQKIQILRAIVKTADNFSDKVFLKELNSVRTFFRKRYNKNISKFYTSIIKEVTTLRIDLILKTVNNEKGYTDIRFINVANDIYEAAQKDMTKIDFTKAIKQAYKKHELKPRDYSFKRSANNVERARAEVGQWLKETFSHRPISDDIRKKAITLYHSGDQNPKVKYLANAHNYTYNYNQHEKY